MIDNIARKYSFPQYFTSLYNPWGTQRFWHPLYLFCSVNFIVGFLATLVLLIYPIFSSNLVSSSFERVYLTNQIGLVMTNTKVPKVDKNTGEVTFVTEKRGPFMNYIWTHFIMNNEEFDVPVINY
jgi:hypothetical protein